MFFSRSFFGGLVFMMCATAVHSQLAPAYRVSGISHGFDGVYYRINGDQCNGKPVYHLGGSTEGYVLFQPDDGSYWKLDDEEFATNCEGGGYVDSHGSCARSPDGGGCAGRWKSVFGSCGDDWCTEPALTVQALNCAAACGVHGAPAPASRGPVCSCICQDDYVGSYCEMAPAYQVSGVSESLFDGIYSRMDRSHLCNGKNVYEHADSDIVIFQPAGHSYWKVDELEYATNCETGGYIASFGSCAESPDGVGCAGRWQETVGDCDESWCPVPSLTVHAVRTGDQPLMTPCELSSALCYNPLGACYDCDCTYCTDVPGRARDCCDDFRAEYCEAGCATSPPSPTPPPAPPVVSGPCDTYPEFMAYSQEVTAACCDDASAPCVAGLPTACSKGCGDVLLPMQASCHDFLTSIGMQETIDAAATECPLPQEPCTNYPEFVAYSQQVTEACCNEREPCVAGLPTVCNDVCADVLLPMQRACSDFLNTIGMAQTINTAVATCGSGH